MSDFFWGVVSLSDFVVDAGVLGGDGPVEVGFSVGCSELVAAPAILITFCKPT